MKKIIILFLLLMIIPLALAEEVVQEQTLPSYMYADYGTNPSAMMPWTNDYCNQSGQIDFLVQIDPTACSPTIVRSDLLEEQDVPVFCRLTGIKVNPLIDVPYIKKINLITNNKSTYLYDPVFYPARAALSYYDYQTGQGSRELAGVPTMSNLGYILLRIKKQPDESKMPERVTFSSTLEFTYDVAKTFGINENQFVLPVLDNSEWNSNYKKYSFWNGKGYLRLMEVIGDDAAKIAVYSNPNGYPLQIIELKEGEKGSQEIKLPGYYCGAGVKLKLDEITIPENRARILIDGDEYLVGDGEKLGNSGCELSKITPSMYSGGGTAKVYCFGHFYDLKLKPLKVKLNVEVGGVSVASEKEYVTGDAVALDKNEGDSSTKFLYVGHIGQEYTLEKGRGDFVVLFGRTDGVRLSYRGYYQSLRTASDRVNRIVEAMAIHFRNSARAGVDPFETLTANNLKKISQSISSHEVERILVLKRPGKETNEPFKIDNSKEVKVTLKEAEGPLQITYSKDVEEYYLDAIEDYQAFANTYAFTEAEDGTYYGIKALLSAADLAKRFNKNIDYLEILSSIIDKYADSDGVSGIVDYVREKISYAYFSGDSSSINVETSSGGMNVRLLMIEKPSYESQRADIELDGDKNTFILNDIIGDWAITKIENDQVQLTRIRAKEETNKISKSGEEELRNNYGTEFLHLNEGKRLDTDGPELKLVSTHLKMEAKVTVLPMVETRTTKANFSFNIGIEKRSIKLAPEKIKELIVSLDKVINTAEKIREGLNTVVSVWKKACFVGGAALWVKNLVTGIGGKAYARQIVMKRYSDLCSDPDYREQLSGNSKISVSRCYQLKEKEINMDVEIVSKSLSKTDTLFKNAKKDPGVIRKGSGLFGISDEVDEKKLMEAISNRYGETGLATTLNVRMKLGDMTLEEIKGYAKTHDGNTIVDNLDISDPSVRFANKDKIIEFATFNIKKDLIDELPNKYENGEIFRGEVKDILLNLQVKEECKDSKYQEEDLEMCDNIDHKLSSQLWRFSLEGLYNAPIKQFNDILGYNVDFRGEQEHTPLEVAKILNHGELLKYFSGINKTFLESNYLLKNFAFLATTSVKYLLILDKSGAGDSSYQIIGAFVVTKEDNKISLVGKLIEDTPTAKTLTEEIIGKLKIDRVKEIDPLSCQKNNIKDPEVKFWETGPYQGMVALMPLDRNAGWYLATQGYSGLENAMVAWKENGDINAFWICNVGPDGKTNFDFQDGPYGDDAACCRYIVLPAENQDILIPTKDKQGSDAIINRAKKCSRDAKTKYERGERTIRTDCGDYKLGKPPAATPTMQCEDFMSPTDCNIMFNICDPVICPSSRCDFGGRYPVDNVVGTGIIGSLLLCQPNFDQGHGVLVPVCLTGLHAGVDNLINAGLKPFRDCLQEQLDTGKTVGICDEIFSIYMCEFLWRELTPIVRFGLPKIASSIFNSGGGEYALFQESWQISLDSIKYFTDYYAKDSFEAFKIKSSAQAGTEICKNFVSIVYPNQADFLEDLSEPESPPFFWAKIQENELEGPSPESHYKISYQLYAGRDRGAYYSIYLKNPPVAGYYQTAPQFVIPNGFGYIPAGEYVAKTPDFTASAGYKEICIRLNEKEYCGFGQVTSSFAIEEWQNLYLESQLTDPVTSAEECIGGTPSLIPTPTLNLQGMVQTGLHPEIYKRGVVRVCSGQNPGLAENSNRWKQIGVCGNSGIGCYLDLNSVNESISDLGIVEDVIDYAEESNLERVINAQGFLTSEEAKDKLHDLNEKFKEVISIAKKYIADVRKSLNLDDDSITGFDTLSPDFEKRRKDILDSLKTLKEEYENLDEDVVHNTLKAEINYKIAQIRDEYVSVYSAEFVLLAEKKIVEEKPNVPDEGNQLGPCESWVGRPKTGGEECKENEREQKVTDADGNEVICCIPDSEKEETPKKIGDVNCNAFTANQCRDSSLTGNTCFWDTKEKTCKYCPTKCSGTRTGLGISWIGWEQRFLNTQTTCEENTCDLDCWWAFRGNNQKYLLTYARDYLKLKEENRLNLNEERKTRPEEVLDEFLDQDNFGGIGQCIGVEEIESNSQFERFYEPLFDYFSYLEELREEFQEADHLIENLANIYSFLNNLDLDRFGGSKANLLDEYISDTRWLLVDLDYGVDPLIPNGPELSLNGCWPFPGHKSDIIVPSCSELGSDGSCQIGGCSIGARCFGSVGSRSHKHAGIDLTDSGNGDTIVGSKIVAIMDGEVTNMYRFYDYGDGGENLCAILVYNEEEDITINYGEVGKCTGYGKDLVKVGINVEKVGSKVKKGEVLAKIYANSDGTAMLHLEIYSGRVVKNLRWALSGEKPENLLDPSGILSEIKRTSSC
ncbi:MAG: M23 family metallopeptidase [archaeon]